MAAWVKQEVEAERKRTREHRGNGSSLEREDTVLIPFGEWRRTVGRVG